jgi:hypothetical protein
MLVAVALNTFALVFAGGLGWALPRPYELLVLFRNDPSQILVVLDVFGAYYLCRSEQQSSEKV